ncbi:MAG: IPExxxVDY family protein [Lacibacter sp.]|jgi:hypothetical protein
MKLKLDNELVADAFFENTWLLGIVAPLEAHQFVWHVNNTLRFDLRINNSLEIQLVKKNRNYFFPVYTFHEPLQALEYFLYKNVFDGEYLLPEFRHLDYLLLAKGDLPDASAFQNLQQALRQINGVQLVVELAHEKIKNRQHLVL